MGPTQQKDTASTGNIVEQPGTVVEVIRVKVAVVVIVEVKLVLITAVAILSQ